MNPKSSEKEPNVRVTTRFLAALNGAGVRLLISILGQAARWIQGGGGVPPYLLGQLEGANQCSTVASECMDFRSKANVKEPKSGERNEPSQSYHSVKTSAAGKLGLPSNSDLNFTFKNPAHSFPAMTILSFGFRPIRYLTIRAQIIKAT
jgi:hypothetical protein